MTDTATLADDPLWFKDAIIYEVPIRAFQDSTNDGIGDINGLIERLDYICDLGVTAIWLLPFYPSPLKDGGYDIADYATVHDHYGSREDFVRLLDEAHRRSLRVITELVLNHTSSEHPWFQAARRAPPGSPARDFYVWSDTAAPYADARIIFKDFETSNWAWDPVAKAYYWHRFYSHQPDLNFDNPAVHEAMLQVIDLWFGLGVDGMRLDAVPYLYEREGTSCENLAETHAFLKKLRAHVDDRFKNRLLLAEANQWPTDAAAYYGAGDECHMNFHFPLMPRMFVAIETEDSFPIVNILKRTPRIPETCQWATFLRNHDELTLEMVTDEDRDTMYRGYAGERAARLNLGIRRRLAPLLGARSKIELMTSLLLSLPGTPVLYYGDEIGMGDNIYLGDRDGVRTPMQWCSDRNGGFSRANPQMLYLPTIIDPAYHYEAVNVETQQGDPASLLWWMKRLIAKRKEHRLFGRGSIEFVTTDNPRVLAFVRELEGETMLVVANLSRFVQCVRLSLDRFKTMVPVEVFGRMRFPEISDTPYFMSLGAFGFYWLGIEAVPAADAANMRPVLGARGSWTALLAPGRRRPLERALLAHAVTRPWFRGKARNCEHAMIVDVLMFDNEPRFAIALLQLDYHHGPSELYILPIAFSEDSEAIEATRTAALVISHVTLSDVPGRGTVAGTIYDALTSEAFDNLLLATMLGTATAKGQRGALVGEAFPLLRDRVAAGTALPSRITATDDSRRSRVIFGEHLMLKLPRVLEAGQSTELEVARFLSTRDPACRGVPRLAGVLDYRPSTHPHSTFGTLFELPANQGDAWQLTQDALAMYFDKVLADDKSPDPPAPTPVSILERARTVATPQVIDRIGPYLERVHLLGVRTAELHIALASGPRDSSFAPESFDLPHQQSICGSAIARGARTFDRLRERVHALSAENRKLAEAVLSREVELDNALGRVTSRRIDAVRTRIHGDYHLARVLWTGDDFTIIDFEGEVGQPLSQRRAKRSPLRDVAGMLRSLQYASASATRDSRRRPEDLPRLVPWAAAWSGWVSGSFIAGYLQRATGERFLPRTDADLELVLDFFMLERCLDEIGYELAERPEWVDIPLVGLLALLEPQ